MPLRCQYSQPGRRPTTNCDVETGFASEALSAMS
jgi:hypothetical protein